MQFLSYLKESAEKIENALLVYLQQEVQESKKVSTDLEPLVRLFARSCEGGKRVRGSLVMLGYELVTGTKQNRDILKAALAFEVFQTAILAHDDVIDQSPLRRGKPTIFKALGGDHYGMSQAICLGDTGFFLAFQLIAKSNFSDKLKLRALVSFNDTMLKTAAGQMLDVLIPHRQTEILEKDAITIAHLKTAHYTIIGPLHLGAILGGAGEEVLKKLGDYGENLGIAFQIQDDILGVFGDEKVVGKSISSDIEEGKNTLLVSYALTHSKSKDKELLKTLYGKSAITDKELATVRRIFEDSGALDYAGKVAVEYVSRAKQVIPSITEKEYYQKMLTQLADFLITRSK